MGQPKIKVGVTLDADLLGWIRARTGPGLQFSSISHGIERAIYVYSRAGKKE